MLFRNYTPFSPLHFISRDAQRQDFGVVVLKGTFRIVAGAELRLIPDQKPLVLADDFSGEPGQSSLRFDNEIAPYKPKTDFHVTAVAYSSSGRPEEEWVVRVQLGRLEKQILVTGPRRWVRGSMGWTITPTEAASTVPVRYEYAFGGSYAEAGELKQWDDNPVGTGFAHPKAEGPITVPQLLPVGFGKPRFGSPIPVEGLGPIAPSWSPRLKFAGTYNLLWEKTRWPDLPEDFDFAFYNSSARGMTYEGFIDGSEWIRVQNLHPTRDLRMKLPSFRLATLIRYLDGQIAPGPMNLDTVHVDLIEERVYLVWRGIFSVSKPIRALEARMKAPDHIMDHTLAKSASERGTWS